MYITKKLYKTLYNVVFNQKFQPVKMAEGVVPEFRSNSLISYEDKIFSSGLI